MPKIAALLFAVLLFAAGGSAAAKEDKLPEADSPSKVKPGQTALLKAPKGMRNFLRVPKTWDPKKSARLIVFLHGSNMKGLDYVRSFEAKHWADDDILLCPNGEQGTDPYGTNNFTFASAPLVADCTAEVQKALKPQITYVGGHSQGGFLTYSVILLNPGQYQGAMPMAGDCWSQNEPSLWEDKEEIAKEQHAIAIAVVHAKNDPVVDFSQGEHAYDCFRAEGWQKVRFFTPENAAHMFMMYPVDEVLDWLDAMNGRNEKKTLSLIDEWAKDGEWGWALAAAKAQKTPNPKITKGAEDAAAKAVPAMTEAMKGKPSDWIPKWFEFWRIYGATDAAKPLVAKYLEKRHDQHREAEQMMWANQAAFRAKKPDEAYKILDDMLAKVPQSYEAYFAWKWLSERDAKK
jgi:predicted esterase